MTAVNPVIELVNTPVPEPSEVLVLNAIVGPVVVLQHTPRAVTDAPPPSAVTFPPDVADDAVIDVAAVVAARVGNATKAVPPIMFVHVVPLYT